MKGRRSGIWMGDVDDGFFGVVVVDWKEAGGGGDEVGMSQGRRVVGSEVSARWSFLTNHLMLPRRTSAPGRLISRLRTSK